MKNAFKIKSLLLLILIFLFSINSIFADTEYKVQKGDTLYSISKKYQITVAELRAANNLSEKDVLKADQKLVIPTADISNAVALSGSNKNQKNENTAKTKVYEVKKGETLYRIAKNNEMTVAQLLLLNNLDSDAVIKVGQKLKVYDIKSSKSESTFKTTAQNPVSNNTVDSVTPDTRTYGNEIRYDANVVWPVKNPKVTPVKGKVSGVQLSANQNETVKSIRAGTVMYVGVYRGFGQVLFIQSNTGLIYAYTGMGSIKVKKGDYVNFGAEVGTAGVDSITGKPQITFMVFQNGQPIDPVKAPRN